MSSTICAGVEQPCPARGITESGGTSHPQRAPTSRPGRRSGRSSQRDRRDKGGELLGAASHPAEREADPLATRVLNRGDAIAAPRGRADDFSWPRANPSSTAEDVELPDAVPLKAPTETKPVVIKSDEAKKHPAQSAPTPVRAKTAPSR